MLWLVFHKKEVKAAPNNLKNQKACYSTDIESVSNTSMGKKNLMK